MWPVHHGLIDSFYLFFIVCHTILTPIRLDSSSSNKVHWLCSLKSGSVGYFWLCSATTTLEDCTGWISALGLDSTGLAQRSSSVISIQKKTAGQYIFPNTVPSKLGNFNDYITLLVIEKELPYWYLFSRCT